MFELDMSKINQRPERINCPAEVAEFFLPELSDSRHKFKRTYWIQSATKHCITFIRYYPGVDIYKTEIVIRQGLKTSKHEDLFDMIVTNINHNDIEATNLCLEFLANTLE